MVAAARAKTGVKLGWLAGRWSEGRQGLKHARHRNSAFGKTGANQPERRASRAESGAQHDSVLRVVRANSSSPCATALCQRSLSRLTCTGRFSTAAQ